MNHLWKCEVKILFDTSLCHFCTGTPALTSRGLKEADFEKVVDFIDEGIQIALDIKKKTGEIIAHFCLNLSGFFKSVFINQWSATCISRATFSSLATQK